MSVQICPYKDAACSEFLESSRCADCPTRRKALTHDAELQAKITRMEAELAEEKRLFTQLCKQHETVAMEAQLLRAKLAALEGQQGEPVAWLFACKAPGRNLIFASIDENDNSHWPIDHWKTIDKKPLYLAAGAREAQPAHDRAAFEKWAKIEGLNIRRSESKIDGGIPSSRFGLSPATYYFDEAECAWRAWANKPLAQPAREAQPLTDDQLFDMLGNVFDSDDETFIRFAREIEKHHGIKGGQEND